MNLKFRTYDGENFWYFTSEIGVFYKHFGGEQSSFDDYMEFSEIIDKGWPVDQWTGIGDIYANDKDNCGNVVEFLNGSWCLNGDRPLRSNFEIIGNTHEGNK